MPNALPDVKRSRLKDILAQVSLETGVSVEDICSPSKRALFVRARSFFALKAREQGYVLIDIGETINRTHGAVIELLKKNSTQAEVAGPDREGAVPFPVQAQADPLPDPEPQHVSDIVDDLFS